MNNDLEKTAYNTNDNGVVVNNIRIWALPETQLNARPKKPSYKLLLDDLELMQSYDSPSSAINVGKVLVEHEVDMLIEDLEKERRRVKVYMEDGLPDLSQDALETRSKNISQLLEKLKAIQIAECA